MQSLINGSILYLSENCDDISFPLTGGKST